MSDQIDRQSPHSGTATILEAVADWVAKYRSAIGLREELAHCGAEEVGRIANDIGLSSEEFVSLASKGQRAAEQLSRLLRALGVDPDEFASIDPRTMRALERVCITCGHKNKCERDLAAGTAAQGSYTDYCPNAQSLNSIFESKFEM